MSTSGLQALSDADLDALAEFLGNNTNPDALTLEGVNGLFCALIASPESVPPHEYLPVIWGGELPDESAFASIEEANTHMSLIMRYWNTIIADLERESIHLPFIVEPGIYGIPGRAWAQGSCRGLGWRRAGGASCGRRRPKDPDWPKEPLTQEKKNELLKWTAILRAVPICHRDVATDEVRKASRARAPDSPCRASIGYANSPADERVASTGAKQSSRGKELPSTKTVLRPAAPVVSLFDCDHTTNACRF